MEPFNLKRWKFFAKSGGIPSKKTIVDQITIDSRRIHSKHTAFIALDGKKNDGHSFVLQAAHLGASYAIVKKGFTVSNLPSSCTLLHVDSPLNTLQELAKLYRQQQSANIIAITGSQGKTLTKDLLTTIVQSCHRITSSPESFNSQIGVPLSLFTIHSKDRYAFIEAGISQLGEMERLSNIILPNAAILTSIGEAHQETLGPPEVITQEKAKLLHAVPSQGWCLLPDPSIKLSLSSSKYCWNSVQNYFPHASIGEKKTDSTNSYILQFPDGNKFEGTIPSHYFYILDIINISVKAAWLLQIPAQSIIDTLTHYIPEPMRTEQWISPSGIYMINSSYCSHPQSIDHAFNHLQYAPKQKKKFFFFGGLRKTEEKSSHKDYERIGNSVALQEVDEVLLYGEEDFSSFHRSLKNKSPETTITRYDAYEEATKHLQSHLKIGDILLHQGPKKKPFDQIAKDLSDDISQTQCLIHLPSIRANLTALKNHLPQKNRIMVMVKALAYGTNNIHMANFLASCGIDILGVSFVEEGVSLRKAGVTQDIFVLNTNPSEVKKIIQWNLQPAVSDASLVFKLQEAAKQKKKQILIHLHIDTGMGRLGCRPEDAILIAKAIQTSQNLIFEGVFTHFSSADDPKSDPFTHHQIHRFDQTIEQLKTENIHWNHTHAANSSAALRFHLPKYSMVRIGLAAFGLLPSSATQGIVPLKLALSLVSHLIGINHCTQGDPISYGRSYTVQQKKARIGVIPIGYFDGLHRSYSGKGEVIICGKRAPMVGKICMDYFMIDITEIPEAEIGDPVLIFGRNSRGQSIAPEELAIRGGSIPYELITCLGPRVQRVFINE